MVPTELKNYTAEPERGFVGFMQDMGAVLGAVFLGALILSCVIAVLSLGLP